MCRRPARSWRCAPRPLQWVRRLADGRLRRVLRARRHLLTRRRDAGLGERPTPGGGKGTLTVKDSRTGKTYEIQVRCSAATPRCRCRVALQRPDGASAAAAAPGAPVASMPP